jgi:hypothetical protein
MWRRQRPPVGFAAAAKTLMLIASNQPEPTGAGFCHSGNEANRRAFARLGTCQSALFLPGNASISHQRAPTESDQHP